jgi:hypothetical protein
MPGERTDPVPGPVSEALTTQSDDRGFPVAIAENPTDLPLTCTDRVRLAAHVTMLRKDSAQVSSKIVGFAAVATGTPGRRGGSMNVKTKLKRVAAGTAVVAAAIGMLGLSGGVASASTAGPSGSSAALSPQSTGGIDNWHHTENTYGVGWLVHWHHVYFHVSNRDATSCLSWWTFYSVVVGSALSFLDQPKAASMVAIVWGYVAAQINSNLWDGNGEWFNFVFELDGWWWQPTSTQTLHAVWFWTDPY